MVICVGCSITSLLRRNYYPVTTLTSSLPKGGKRCSRQEISKYVVTEKSLELLNSTGWGTAASKRPPYYLFVLPPD
jgi:hypothetical protein